MGRRNAGDIPANEAPWIGDVGGAITLETEAVVNIASTGASQSGVPVEIDPSFRVALPALPVGRVGWLLNLSITLLPGSWNTPGLYFHNGLTSSSGLFMGGNAPYRAGHVAALLGSAADPQTQVATAFFPLTTAWTWTFWYTHNGAGEFSHRRAIAVPL